MSHDTTLVGLLERSAASYPDRPALEEPSGASIGFAELDALAEVVRRRLAALGVHRGDRVGICVPKSIDTVAAIHGVMKAGAAYVPVDPGAPASRSGFIMSDCDVRVVIAESRHADALRAEMASRGATPPFIVLDGFGGGEALRAAMRSPDEARAPDAAPDSRPGADDLAYILYTSGSTGTPKGVMLTHRNAVAFVDWCSSVFNPTEEDRFSSHAPLHFDLSILDLYVALRHGAAVVLIGPELGKDPLALAALIAERRISVWYSTPSVLSLLVQFGRLDRHDYPALRLVLFAGEVFPVKFLRALQRALPRPQYWNLYGPTETNVCTSYRIPGSVPDERTEPYPIGEVCAHLRSRIVDEQGGDADPGKEGELCIAGDNVTSGYWNLPEQTRRAFLPDDGSGARWYRTGDIVVEGVDGNLIFLGRRDRMVKRRGYRIELGEIEAGLYRHPAVKEAAVVATTDGDQGVRITAFLRCHDGARPTTIELKRFCAETLPMAMVPDQFTIREALPKTSTDKIDYQQLLQLR
jgi:amino acid adenylation domain-containing protein